MKTSLPAWAMVSERTNEPWASFLMLFFLKSQHKKIQIIRVSLYFIKVFILNTQSWRVALKLRTTLGGTARFISVGSGKMEGREEGRKEREEKRIRYKRKEENSPKRVSTS